MLSQNGPALVLVMPYVEKADEGKVNEINDLYEWAIEVGVPFLCLSASNPDGVEQWIDTTGAEYPFAWADDVLLKTMIRSNPGLILLSDGAVKGKWAHLNMPTNVELNDIQLND